MRDLRAQGSVTALAFNDPKRLDELDIRQGDGDQPATGRGWDNDD